VKPALAVLAMAAALAAAGTAGGAVAGAPRCKGSQLTGRFAVVPGSAGAGNIVYELELTNVSFASCTLTGLPQGVLLGRQGGRLPTHIRAAFPPGLTAILVTLRHSHSATAKARFSPDVPGTGEQNIGQCEPKAYRFRVTAPGGGTMLVALRPPTPVCEHGTLSFSAYGYVSN
jgi:hypothetical protein